MFGVQCYLPSKPPYPVNQATKPSSQAVQYFVRVAFLPDEGSHLSLSRFITSGQAKDLYTYQRLSVPIAVLDRGGKKEDVDQVASTFRQHLLFDCPIEAQEIHSFVPFSALYPDVSTGFIVAIFKETTFLRTCHQATLAWVRQQSPGVRLSFWPEFEVGNYFPFMTIGRVNDGLSVQKKVAQILTEKLQNTPLKISFKSFSCESFCFDFEQYFASVDLERHVFYGENPTAFGAFLPRRK